MRPTNPIAIVLAAGVFLSTSSGAETNTINHDAVVGAEKLIGLNFSSNKIEMLLPGLRDQLGKFEALRRVPLSNAIPPAVLFNPIPVGMKVQNEFTRESKAAREPGRPGVLLGGRTRGADQKPPDQF
jgi:hypothetical protein